MCEYLINGLKRVYLFGCDFNLCGCCISLVNDNIFVYWKNFLIEESKNNFMICILSMCINFY